MVSSNVLLIKEFFRHELSEFHVLIESSYSMFWQINLSNNEIEVKIAGDAGGFSISIFIENSEFPLWQYDKKVNSLSKTNDDNILSQMLILHRLIKELNSA